MAIPPKKPFKSTRRPTSAPPAGKPSFPAKRTSATPVQKKKVQLPKPPRVVKASFATKADATDSWNSVATWYDNHLTGENTYHNKVVLPNLLRLVAPKRGESVVDLACGNGFFSLAFAKEGAQVTGIDISEELIAIARKHAPAVSFHVSSVEKFDIISDNSKDKVVIVLAIQNIEHTAKVFAEAARILKQGGVLHIVMNHPAFRIPKRSSWEYDEKKKVQYRRIEEYLSESKSAIDMHPGKVNSPQTVSYHRPLQYYFKLLQKAGFTVERLEEWTSHKESDSGPRAKAENDARKEFPLFLYLGAKKAE
jgi:ubiquinone/menaquinone biosynthesis C-methylase UbiE